LIKIFNRLIALIVTALITSCGATRHVVSPSPAELDRFALIIKETPDGQVVHSWKHIEDFDIPQPRPRTTSREPTSHIKLVANRQRDCHEEFNECVDGCLSRPLPSGFEHVPQGGGAHARICRDQCWRAYLDCEELQDRRAPQPHEASSTDEAIDWLKRHRKEILVGAVIIIAGCTFVVVSAGLGVIILAPVVVMASGGAATVPHIAAVSP
jgi:hypothetical protein